MIEHKIPYSCLLMLIYLFLCTYSFPLFGLEEATQQVKGDAEFLVRPILSDQGSLGVFSYNYNFKNKTLTPAIKAKARELRREEVELLQEGALLRSKCVATYKNYKIGDLDFLYFDKLNDLYFSQKACLCQHLYATHFFRNIMHDADKGTKHLGSLSQLQSRRTPL